MRKRNKILKIAEKHGWDTVSEYLDSPLADDKEDAANMRTAIARASRKRSYPKPYDRAGKSPNEGGKFFSGGSSKFDSKSFFRRISQFIGIKGNTGQFQNNITAKCFYCNQADHFARFCPLKEPHRRPSVPQRNSQRHNDVSPMKRQDQHDEVEYSFLN